MVSDGEFDHGPTYINTDGGDSIQRTGPPTTSRRHDKGLGSTGLESREDGNGNTLSGSKQRRYANLSRREHRETLSKADRNLRNGIIEIKRMRSALELSESLEKFSSNLFRQVQEQGHLQGRSVVGMASASLYAGHRVQSNSGLAIEKLARVSQVSGDRIWNCYSVINRNFPLELEPPQPSEFIPELVSALDLGNAHRRRAEDAIKTLSGEDISGRNPRGIAAAAVWATSVEFGEPTQREVCEVMDIAEQTLRNNARRVFEES